MGCYRELIQGISSYGNTEGYWQLEICPPTFDLVRVIASGKPDGLLLGSIESDDALRRIVELVPASVGVCRGYVDAAFPLPAVESDDVEVGRVGAAHLLNKGFRHFACIGQKGTDWSRDRQAGFGQAITEAGCSVSNFEVGWGETLERAVPDHPGHGGMDRWLQNLPKPLGMLVCNDGMARFTCRLCMEIGLRVPDDVAILGVDNDDLSTAIANPPLSSVIIPWRDMGRTASLLLDRRMSGEVIPPVLHTVAPVGIAERQSTGGVAIEDEQVRTAVRFIREHSGSQITVNEVVDFAQTTRRGLERKFRAVLGRSPLEEIRRSRVDRAMRLLSQTSLNIRQIARQSGFGSLTWFTTAFRDITGESPAACRRRIRGK